MKTKRDRQDKWLDDMERGQAKRDARGHYDAAHDLFNSNLSMIVKAEKLIALHKVSPLEAHDLAGLESALNEANENYLKHNDYIYKREGNKDMNLPATFGDSLRTNLQTLVDSVGGGEGFLYLKMDKTGSWMFGRDDDEVIDGSEWAVNPMTAQSGFICWGEMGGAPLGERMTSLTGAPISQGELPDTGFPWQPQLSIQLMCISGEDAGTAVVYKVSSKGGVSAINKLLREVLARDAGSNPEIYPVVKLESYQDKASKYKTWYPVLKQANWHDAASFEAVTSGGTPTAKLEEPAAPAPAVAPEPEAEPPRRRRTRKTVA